MRIVAAVDKFRGTADAAAVASAIGHAAWERDLDCDEVVLSDGGEGMLEVFGGPNRSTAVTGPLGGRVEAGWRLDAVHGGVLKVGHHGSSTSTSEPAVGAQGGAQARYVLPWFGAGVRLQGVYNGRHDRDTTQAAVAPFLDVGLCRRSAERRIQGVMSGTNYDCPVQLNARLNVNLDGPYGFVSPDSLRVWGLQAGLSWAVF